MRFSLAARAVCVHRRSPVVLIAHGIEVWSTIDCLRRRAHARVAIILCVSEYTRRRIIEQAPSLDAARLQGFPNAIDEQWSRMIAAPSDRVLPHRFLLSVSRLEKGDRDTGIVTVLEALALAMVHDPR